jgi:hypothetical protein
MSSVQNLLFTYYFILEFTSDICIIKICSSNPLIKVRMQFRHIRIIYLNFLQVNMDRNSATLHQTLQLVALTPRNMFREESKPPAKTRATCGLERSHTMRHANRDTVIRGTLLVPLLSA